MGADGVCGRAAAGRVLEYSQWACGRKGGSGVGVQAQLRDAELEEQLRLARAEAARLGAELAKLQRASVQALMDTGAKATCSAQASRHAAPQSAARYTQRATYGKAQAVGCHDGARGPWASIPVATGGATQCCLPGYQEYPAGVPRVPCRGTKSTLPGYQEYPAGVPRVPCRGTKSTAWYAEAARTHAGVDCVKICQKSGARKPRKLRADGTNADRFALVGPVSEAVWHGMAWPGRPVGR